MKLKSIFASSTVVLLIAACGGSEASDADSDSALAHCPGYVAPAATANRCWSPSDCSAPELCFGWNQHASCSHAPACTEHLPCTLADSVCKITDGCTNQCVKKCVVGDCAAGETCMPSGLCAPPPCSPTDPCAAGFECSPTDPDADERGCRAIACNAGYACPPNFRCDPSQDAPHGCVPVECKRHADCDCGGCFNGKCAAGPGWCGQQPP
ncbi:MAG TPA: hypothetical protein PKA88_06565 [Polyangiaceae bacterium]|nr:hypothetical protein [Polyangiaceae bacterium]HMR74779.1 hypothetical protein [Polyangiaceae bacterium]